MINQRVVQPLAAVLAAGLVVPANARAVPLLRSADIRVTLEAPDICRVIMTLVLDGGGVVDHRLEVGEGSSVELSAVVGAEPVAAARTIGRTRSLQLHTVTHAYELRYRVAQAAHGRCPLWVPAAPADGVSRAVRIGVELPGGATARGTLPAFTWDGSTGIATLGHIPAFVRVPFTLPGDAREWELAAVMDTLTMIVIAGAGGIWLWRRAARRGGADR